MDGLQTPGSVVRKVVFLTLLGVIAVLLAGPILAVLSALFTAFAVLLAFAFVGFLIWIPFRILAVGPEQAGRNARDLGYSLLRLGAAIPRTAARVLGAPFRVAGWLGKGLVHVLLGILAFLWLSVAVGTEIVLMALLGFVLGAGGGLVLGEPQSLFDGAVLGNALAGAALAALAGGVLAVSSRLPRRRSSVVA